MLSNCELVEYYEAHKEEFPVVFKAMSENAISMLESDDWRADIITIYEDGEYKVFPSDEVPYSFVNSLAEDAKTYAFNLDMENPQSVLTALVDCTYLRLYELRRDIDKLMAIIERGDAEE